LPLRHGLAVARDDTPVPGPGVSTQLADDPSHRVPCLRVEGGVMIVTLCGSMKFFDQMLAVAADETAMGNIVLAPFSVVAPEHQDSDFKAMLDRLHIEKIDMAEKIIVVTNQHGYIGDSTRREMGYALSTDKGMDVREFHLPEPTPNQYGGGGVAT
jgi:hypothetical protein